MHFFVIYSGGMDSYTLLHRVLASRVSFGYKDAVSTVTALSFNYGQRHRKELGFARDVCAKLGVEHHVIQMTDLGSVLTGSALTDGTVAMPHGHYAEESMKKTVVPGRNTILLSAAMGIAEAHALRYGDECVVYYGAHAGDHHIYPDCRPEFVEAMQSVYRRATEGRVRLFAPLINMSKGDILHEGLAIANTPAYPFKVDYGETWTCYEGGEHPCGKCGACVERAEAFAKNGVPDPLLSIGIQEYKHP